MDYAFYAYKSKPTSLFSFIMGLTAFILACKNGQHEVN